MNQIRSLLVRGLLISGPAATLGVGQLAHAGQWNYDPRVILGANYDDNYGLDSGGAQGVSVTGGVLDAGVRIRFADPRTRFEITPRIRSTLYPGHAQDQSNDQFLTSRLEHDWLTAHFTADGFYWRQDVLRSFLPGTEVGTPLGQNTGGADLATINQKIRQDLLFLTPSMLFDLAPRERIEVRAQFMDISYSRQIVNNNQNFKDYAGSLGFQYVTTPLSTVTVRGTAAKLSPESGSGAETYGAEGEWRTRPSELLEAYARVGVDHTRFDSPSANQLVVANTRSSATSFAGGVGVSRKFVSDQLFVDLARSVNPNSAGAVVARNELRLRLEHHFSVRMSGYVGLRGIKEDALGNSASFVNQRYGRAAAGFEWRILQSFSVLPEYAYTNLKQGRATAAGSNSVMFSLVYEPNRPANDTLMRIGY